MAVRDRFEVEVDALGLRDTELVAGIRSRLDEDSPAGVVKAALAYVGESADDPAGVDAIARQVETDRLVARLEAARRDPRNIENIPVRRLLGRVITGRRG